MKQIFLKYEKTKKNYDIYSVYVLEKSISKTQFSIKMDLSIDYTDIFVIFLKKELRFSLMEDAINYIKFNL